MSLSVGYPLTLRPRTERHLRLFRSHESIPLTSILFPPTHERMHVSTTSLSSTKSLLFRHLSRKEHSRYPSYSNDTLAGGTFSQLENHPTKVSPFLTCLCLPAKIQSTSPRLDRHTKGAEERFKTSPSPTLEIVPL